MCAILSIKQTIEAQPSLTSVKAEARWVQVGELYDGLFLSLHLLIPAEDLSAMSTPPEQWGWNCRKFLSPLLPLSAASRLSLSSPRQCTVNREPIRGKLFALEEKSHRVQGTWVLESSRLPEMVLQPLPRFKINQKGETNWEKESSLSLAYHAVHCEVQTCNCLWEIFDAF